MRLSPSFHFIIQLAIQECLAGSFHEIEPEHFFMAILRFTEINMQRYRHVFGDVSDADICEQEQIRLAGLFSRHGVDTTQLRRSIRKRLGRGNGTGHQQVLHRSRETKGYFMAGFSMAIKNGHNSLSPYYLIIAMALHPTPLLAGFPEIRSMGQEAQAGDSESGRKDQSSSQTCCSERKKGGEGFDLAGLTQKLRQLRYDLNQTVLGQPHAIDTFIEGLFNAEMLPGSERMRPGPRGIFVFAGPPGVGKTFLAEKAAELLGMPFKRFDMSGYSGHDESYSLTGIHKSYKEAHPGILTSFVKANPRSVLLFDEIEKAHPNIIHLFLQILDAGRLEDKFTEEIVDFSETIIIFTTNAGKNLYGDPNRFGVRAANSLWHRKTIIDALEKDINPLTGAPFFPPAICSRLATGYPVMFNHLGVNELEKICASVLERTGKAISRVLGMEVEFDQFIPLCLLLQTGANADARMVSARCETFIKEEIFRFSLLSQRPRLERIIGDARKMVFEVDDLDLVPEEARTFFSDSATPRVLLIADEQLKEAWQNKIGRVEWLWTDNGIDAINILKSENVDIVLLDLWIGQHEPKGYFAQSGTVYQFDFVPDAAKDIAAGQEILRSIHEKCPDIPCFLISFKKESGRHPVVDDELFLACARSGGARGVVETSFLSPDIPGWENEAGLLERKIQGIVQDMRRETKARHLSSKHKVLFFDTAPEIDRDIIRIRLRNLRFKYAVSATDVSAMVQEAERPRISFENVYGADVAKNELKFIVKWLKEPRRFAGLGLRPPRGVLLYGPPGTGKTMLARALAGESNCPFFPAAATGFVTKWQGSGPENIRRLFEKARRYAPSIVFIDEIDAIGKKRGGMEGASSAAEQTLNALLVEMDGFAASSDRPVVVIAATNLAELLDDALRRRFDREVEVDRPDRKARSAYLSHRLQEQRHGNVSDRVIDRIAASTVGMTIADLERVIQLAGRMAAEQEHIITDKIIEEALETIRMGPGNLHSDPAVLRRLACHEAGHCLIAWLMGQKPLQVTIVGRGSAGGYMEKEIDEHRIFYTADELRGLIRQAMAGRAAEIVYYGPDQGLSSGVASDLKLATRYAEQMVRDFGMGTNIGQVALNGHMAHSSPMAIRITREVEKIISEELEHAIKEINENRRFLDLLIKALLDSNRLTLADLEMILGDMETN